MAYSAEFAKKTRQLALNKEAIKNLGSMPGISALLGAPAYVLANTFLSSAISPFITVILAPVVGVATGALINSIAKKSHTLLAPTEIDSSYQPKPLRDAEIQDRICMGLGMRIDDFKSGFELYKDFTGLAGAKAIRSYQSARAHDYYPVYLEDNYLTRHFIFMGQTGVGKTEAQLAMLKQSIARGGGGLMVEMKGDGSLPARAYQIAKQYGAEKRFRLISLDDVAISLKYNPLGNASSVRSDISKVMSLLSANGEQFHRDVANWTLSVAISAILRQPNKPTYTLGDIYQTVSNIEIFYDLYENMTTRTEDEINDKIFVGSFFKQFETTERDGSRGWNLKTYTDRVMGLLAALQSFVSGDFAKILNNTQSDLNLRQSIENGEIVIVSANTLKDKEGSATFGRLLMADLAVAIGMIQSEKTKPLLPFPVWLDEYPSFKHSFHQVLFQLARSANVGIIVGVQGFSFLKDNNAGAEFANNVIANCWNHVFFDIRDPETREICAKLAGTIIRSMEQTNESSGASEGHDKAHSDLVGNKGRSTSISSGYKATREDEIQPEDLRLDPGDAVWIGKLETKRIRLPMLTFKSDEPDLREVFKSFEVFEKQGVTTLGIRERTIASMTMN